MTRNPVEDNEPFSAVYWSGILNEANYEAVISGLVPSKGTGDYDVDYTAGQAIAGGSVVSPGSGTVTLATGDASNPRVDLITVDSGGVVDDVTGTPAADPIAPSIPANETLIAAVEVPDTGTQTSISAAGIHDYRVITGDPAPVIQDGGPHEMDASDFAGSAGSNGDLLESDGSAAAWEATADIPAEDFGGQGGGTVPDQFLHGDGAAASFAVPDYEASFTFKAERFDQEILSNDEEYPFEFRNVDLTRFVGGTLVVYVDSTASGQLNTVVLKAEPDGGGTETTMGSAGTSSTSPVFATDTTLTIPNESDARLWIEGGGNASSEVNVYSAAVTLY